MSGWLGAGKTFAGVHACFGWEQLWRSPVPDDS